MGTCTLHILVVHSALEWRNGERLDVGEGGIAVE
jgi:hypothetical protein